MQAVRYHEQGGPDVLQVDEIEKPEIGPTELLVAVEAAGVNPVDTYFRAGSYEPFALPMIPGSDVAGTIEAVGDDVTEFEPGERVFSTGLGRDHQGTYAEYSAVPIDRVAKLPEAVSAAVGAGIALVGATAWRALIDHAGLEPGETCLIHGGNGGVGHAAVQLGAAVGAETITTARPEYHDDLRKLGADVVYDYSQNDLQDVIGEHEPAVILDHMLDEYMDFDVAVAAPRARIVGIGHAASAAGFENIGSARGKETSWYLMSMFNSPSLASILNRLASLLEHDRLTATIHRSFPLHEAATAHESVMNDSFMGKLVIEP